MSFRAQAGRDGERTYFERRHVLGTAVGALTALVLVLPAKQAAALTISFDDTSTTAPATLADFVPGGEFGPALTFGPASLDGGAIALAITPSDQAATTLPNFYVTSDFLLTGDGSLLPGVISGAFSTPMASISLDVGNGNLFAAAFTLTAFNGASVVASDTIMLNPFANPAGFVGHLEVIAAQITSFAVTSDQPAGAKVFSIDSISALAIPEPGTGTLTLLGLGLLAFQRSRRA